ncbi:uncharacterized protein Pyn_16533 [Prunus yedoensis var. nudiflora]|uniref:DUF7788 domain-containing protein n=1 Tax=Prunus yedoensis var. nudiflora TaxID=2094558 RepID=A0A314UYF2_PRUYE|nr:uncharacterized protein Pyn_16533 [Prunus yedoensis var. nudiflora]
MPRKGDSHHEIDADLWYPGAAECCTIDCGLYRAIFLHESIEMRLLLPESNVSEEWERLKRRRGCGGKKYLEEVKATTAAGRGGNLRGGIGIIKPDALLPHEIIKYVQDEDDGEAAELKWKAMVEDIKQNQGEGLGKLKNCLVVGNSEMDYSDEMSSEVGLELLVSEVSEEPWKGKMIKYSGGKYQLDLIQDHDLKSKLEFIKRRYTNANNRKYGLWPHHSGGV